MQGNDTEEYTGRPREEKGEATASPEQESFPHLHGPTIWKSPLACITENGLSHMSADKTFTSAQKIVPKLRLLKAKSTFT